MNTITQTRAHPLLANFSNWAIGHDSLLEEMLNQIRPKGSITPTYPPHNLIKEDDQRYRIELAVAGFSKSDLEVKVDKDILIISGKKKEQEHQDNSIIYRGIGQRSFSKSFHLAENVVVNSASFQDGLIIVILEQIRHPKSEPKVFNLD